MHTIGTAGHIDHGKTTLCKLLTGVDTDRLDEEKRRGISIELGFAHLKTPGGRSVGLVDVPGHEKFVRTMVAGAWGLDAFLFCIAADEGVMPQTREHFDILRLLGVTTGIVVFTKCDTVDREWLDMVRADVKAYLAGTPFASSTMVEVSRTDARSIERLHGEIDRLLGGLTRSHSHAHFRMPVDRIFTLKGHGTVVTGTVASGHLEAGQTVEILPAGLSSRVRSIQTFFSDLQQVQAGQRGALNLPDVEVGQLERGDTIATPGVFRPSPMIDARLTMLETLPSGYDALEHMDRIRFHAGTAEVIGRIYLMEGARMTAGQEQVVQFRLERPVVCHRGDRILLRTFSPMHTIGGGVVLDANPVKHRRDSELVVQLGRLTATDPAVLLADYLDRHSSVLVLASVIQKDLALPADVIDAAAQTGAPSVVIVARQQRNWYGLRSRLDSSGARLKSLVTEFHRRSPLAAGIDRASLQALYGEGLDSETFSELLGQVSVVQGLTVDGAVIRRSDFAPTLDPQTEAQVRTLERILLDDGFVGLTDLANSSGQKRQVFDKLFGYMIDQGLAVKLPQGLVAHGRTVALYEKSLVEFLGAREKAAVSEIKEHLVLTRKGLIPLLEHFDNKGLTVRAGNDRRLRTRTAR